MASRAPLAAATADSGRGGALSLPPGRDLGAVAATSSSTTAPGSTSTSAHIRSTRRRSATIVRARRPRQGGGADPRGPARRRRAAAREEGIRGDIYLFKNNTDSAGNSYGCHENYLDRAGRGLRQDRRVLIPFLVTPPDLLRRGQGAADGPRGAMYCVSPARRAHLGGRVVGDHPQPADHQHPRRAARRRRALPPAPRDRRGLEHERVRPRS